MTTLGRLGCALVACACLAQEAATSPHVSADRRVTFRLQAPKASVVKLWGDWITKYNTTEELLKNEAGVWSVTIGPLAPGRHSYLFIVDELPVLDPANPAVALGADGVEANLVSITGENPMPDDVLNVPHGAVHMHWYHSSSGLSERRIVVYTPPGYATGRGEKYPVLFLLHGSGGTEIAWTSIGSANFIADNLIARKRMHPMLIVMPNGHGSAAEQDLIRDVIPMIDSLYRVKRGADHRAMAGASMGGFQALAFGMRHTQIFGNIGVFSAGAHGDEGARQVNDAAMAGKLNRMKLFFIGAGDKDPLLKDAQSLNAILTHHKVPHRYRVTPDAGHTWLFWRECLAEFLQELFRPSRM
jgi:enterochelin esterase-like enzyme